MATGRGDTKHIETGGRLAVGGCACGAGCKETMAVLTLTFCTADTPHSAQMSFTSLTWIWRSTSLVQRHLENKHRHTSHTTYMVSRPLLLSFAIVSGFTP